MTKLLFVCHGNICRSPMAEFIMKKLICDAGREDEFEIASAATSTEEIGNPVYPPARRKLAEHGIRCDGKTARQMTRADYAYYDLIICMDRHNIYNINRIIGRDSQNKVHMLMEYTFPSMNSGQAKLDFCPVGKSTSSGAAVDVADPWYTGNFEATWRDCLAGCKALLEQL